MTAGAISSRYARALYLLVQESGRGEAVFTQAREFLDNSAYAPAELEDALARLLILLRRNHRTEYLKPILIDFVRLYCREQGICIAHLSTAAPSDGLGERLRDMLASRSGKRVLMDTRPAPSLIGGFVLELDDETMDASVRRQIDLIRSEFTEKNKRII